jgi:hypothetical protein
MKTFTQLRELTGRKPEGQLIVNKKIGRIQIMVYKERNGYVAYVDGDRLDQYRSKNEAEKAATEFIKVLKK